MRAEVDRLDPTGPSWPPELQEQPACNRWLDALATPRPFFLGADSPAYLVMGTAGVAVGLSVLVALGLSRGLPLAVLCAFAISPLGAFVLAGKLRQKLLGADRHVLLEDVLLALGATAGTARLLGQPVLASLDLMILALGAFLTLGRLGCLAGGCCHGRPARLGIRYRTPAVPPALVGVRLFPVQLVESAWLALVTAVGVALHEHPAGTAMAFWLLAYGAGRFVLEWVRGDVGRPRLGPLSEAQWISLAILAALVVREEAAAGFPPARAAAGGVTAAMVVLAWLSRRWWFTPPRSVLSERDVRPWEEFLTALEQQAREGEADVPRDSPTPGVSVSLRIDLGDEGTLLYTYVLASPSGELPAPHGFLFAGMIIQRLTRHQVLLAEHDGSRLHLWVLLHALPGRVGSGLRDHPRHVLYRARAFARALEELPPRSAPPPMEPEPALLPPRPPAPAVSLLPASASDDTAAVAPRPAPPVEESANRVRYFRPLGGPHDSNGPGFESGS